MQPLDMLQKHGEPHCGQSIAAPKTCHTYSASLQTVTTLSFPSQPQPALAQSPVSHHTIHTHCRVALLGLGIPAAAVAQCKQYVVQIPCEGEASLHKLRTKLEGNTVRPLPQPLNQALDELQVGGSQQPDDLAGCMFVHCCSVTGLLVCLAIAGCWSSQSRHGWAFWTCYVLQCLNGLWKQMSAVRSCGECFLMRQQQADWWHSPALLE